MTELSLEAKPQIEPIRINGHNKTFICKWDMIETQFMQPLDDLLIDVLEVASAVFQADTRFRRGGDSRPDLGRAWRRHLEFSLAVRHYELWSKPEVAAALTDAIEFLTGDIVSFRFHQRIPEAQAEPFFDFSGAGDGVEADEVILFSGGLDSLAGALDALTNRLGKVILLTHRSSQKAIFRQAELGKFLKRRFGGRVLHLHVRATRSGKLSKDSTQRSRSFLFASLGYVVATMAGARRVSFYENGVVSHNLPIGPHVIETMASRTTHPLSLRKFQQFFDLLGKQPVEIGNRFEWLTKTDVVRKIAELGGAEIIASSVSCTKLRNESREAHHCGACSQCLDRRFAVLAAGLEAHDPTRDYQVDVLNGQREPGRSRLMALDWTRHAMRLPDMDVFEFAGRFTGELVRVTEAYKDDSTTVVEQVFAMHRRHGQSVQQALEREVARQARSIASGALEPTSLLAMIIGAGGDVSAKVDDALLARPALEEQTAPTDDGDARVPVDIFPMRVTFFTENEKPGIEVDGLGCVRHGPAAVAHDLKPQYDADLAEGLAPENHRYVHSDDLAKMRRHVSRNTVFQSVKRCRAQLAELYTVIEGVPPRNDLLIENTRHKGYRLDPTIRIVRRDQLRNRNGK